MPVIYIKQNFVFCANAFFELSINSMKFAFNIANEYVTDIFLVHFNIYIINKLIMTTQ